VMVRREWRFEPSPEELPHARAVLRNWLTAQGVPQSVTSDVLLIASELVTNGVVHDGAGPITVRAEATEDNVRLEVVTIDVAAGKNAERSREAAEGGHGLRIVMGLTRDFAIHQEGRVRTVSCSVCAPRPERWGQ
jgi:anti-sigma regulatory factor (Ser/Thr protein kinase)